MRTWLEGAQLECAMKDSLIIHSLPAFHRGFANPIPSKCTISSNAVERWWFSGRILTCQAGDPVPIPGQCKDSLLLSKVCGSCLREFQLHFQPCVTL